MNIGRKKTQTRNRACFQGIRMERATGFEPEEIGKFLLYQLELCSLAPTNSFAGQQICRLNTAN